MKKTRLKSKEANRLLSKYKLDLNKTDQVEFWEDDHQKLLAINKVPAFFYYGDRPVPTLKYLQAKSLLKKVAIDMGAIKFIVNGADIMRPGIVEIEPEIEKDEFIAIVDVNHKKPLAVGMALVGSDEMQKLASGKVIKNIHYVGDGLWKTE
ncbi:MAG TPA: DUF1947 domain-containing protein [Candidatus Nanoarchaeia archaeon]|nr:DUF1947 domain-containing protein [Candidatus Nanoarchaeia archaeon]